jgi:hypothetical protein
MRGGRAFGRNLRARRARMATPPAAGEDQFSERRHGETSLEWSPHAKWLLAGTLEDLHEWDYYVVNPATMKLTRVATAFPNGVLWLPGRDELLYTTPEDVAPLPGTRRERQVWVRQLIRFEPATGKSTAITSGVTNNFDASLCNP